jgi:hypothetical protein
MAIAGLSRALSSSVEIKDMNTKREDSEEGDHWPPFHILCVDDNRNCADSAALLFKVRGFETRACDDGLTALRLNESFQPGACFLDLQIPGMEGDELAIKLRTNPVWHPLPASRTRSYRIHLYDVLRGIVFAARCRFSSAHRPWAITERTYFSLPSSDSYARRCAAAMADPRWPWRWMDLTFRDKTA